MNRFDEINIGELKVGDSFCFKRDKQKMISSKVISKRGYITKYKRLNEIKKCFQYYKQVLFLKSNETPRP